MFVERVMLAASLIIAAVICSTANAIILIDQDQPNDPIFFVRFSQTDLAQSFQQSQNNIAGAGILLRDGVGTSDNVTIGLWDALPNAGGSLITSASAIGTQGQYVDVFWAPEMITPGITHYLVFSGNTTLGIAGDASNPYPFGQAFATPGFASFPTVDYTFRTFYETFEQVYEPTSLALLGLGLAGLGFVRKRLH